MVRASSLFLTLFLIVATSLPASAGLEQEQQATVDITSSDNQSLNLNFKMDEISFQELVSDDAVLDQYIVMGEGLTWDAGKPVLPAVSRIVIVPPDAGLELIVWADDPQIMQGENLPAFFADDNPDDNIRQQRVELHGLYPSVFAEMSEPVVFRGVRFVQVTTYPLQYDPANNSYLRRDNIETEILFTDSSPVNPAFVPIRRNRSPQMLKLIKDIAINGDQVGRDDPDRDRAREYVGHYLIVGHEGTIEDCAPLFEWKRKSGWKVDIWAVPSNQAMNTNSIKNGIRDRYNAYLDDGVDPFDQIMLIGDRTTYSQSQTPVGQWQLQAERGNPRWADANHADYKYALLEGNDDIPDVSISRWPVGSTAMIGLFLGRQMAYEVEPYMDDPEWFTRGGVFSQHWGNGPTTAWHISIHTNVRWAEEVLQHKGFEDVRFYEYYPHDRNGDRIGPFERDLFNDGSSLHVGRAENYYWRNTFRDVRDREYGFPIRMVASGHGEWPNWNILRRGDANHLKGAVAGTNGWGGPVTFDMTVVWLESVKALLLNDLTFGWARIQALVAPLQYVPNWLRGNVYVATDFDFYGDPGIRPWFGVPRMVETEIDVSITPQTKIIEVYVHAEDNDTLAVEGAQVTLYAPGDMPDFDEDEYAEYDEMFMITRKSNREGIVRFVLTDDVELVENTDLYITVTGRDIRPHFDEFEITPLELQIDIGSYELSETDGNDNDEINPGETYTLTINAENVGGSDIDNVTATVVSLSSFVEVEDGEIEFGDIPEGESAEAETDVTLNISPACPDGESRPVTRPLLIVEFSDGENSWLSAITLHPVAPNIEVKQVVGSGIMDVGAQDLDIVLENVGNVDMPEFNARIVAKGMGINIVGQDAAYPAIRQGEESRSPGNEDFIVAGNALVVPGFINNMLLILTTEDGFIDTAHFELQVREPMRNGPQGPDGYGYICYDDTDQDWPAVPEYEWIEISPEDDNPEFRGTRIEELDGDSDFDIGRAAVIDLGFPTQFYGYDYDQITVTTNGFICPGDQPRITNYQNWPLDRAMGGGAGMIAVFWDDLRLRDGSGIYYHYDRENHRMIIEWYRLRHAQGGNSDLTFQAIIYDKRYWVTVTGDPSLLFQYKSISNVSNMRGGDGAWVSGTPYASVGISGPDGEGINYTFNNRYPISSAPLENQRAIRFATSAQSFASGYISGIVTDAETDEVIPDAVVYTNYGFTATTNDSGYWFIREALAERAFTITAHKDGYNDSAYVDTLIHDGDTLSFYFSLLHPEFTPSTMRLGTRLDQDRSVDIPFEIYNGGNGPLDWTVAKTLPGNAELPPWNLRQSYAVSDTVEDSRIEGVVYVDGRFYVSGANRWGRENGPNMVYVLDHNGNKIDEYEQVGESTYGYRDLAYDGELIWGSGERNVYGFNPESGEVVDTIEGPYSSQQALAWDEDREILWMAGITSRDIVGMTLEGEIVSRLPRKNFRMYGFCYWKDDPDQYPLYIIHHPGQGRQVVHKMNPEDGDTIFVAELDADGSPAGSFATNRFDVYSWVFMNIANDGSNDRIDVWQLDAKRSWFKIYNDMGEEPVEVDAGRLESEQRHRFFLRLNSDEMERVLFEGFLNYVHNAEGLATTIDVSMQVIGPEPPTEFELVSPMNGYELDANEDSTVVEFEWEESIDYNLDDSLVYLTWFSIDEDSLLYRFASNKVQVDVLNILDSLELSNERSFAIRWWVKAWSGEDTVDCAERFSLFFEPNFVPGDGNIPVEFGLHSIYPSPFNSSTTVKFGIDTPERAILRVFDLSGRQVEVLYDNKTSVGNHTVTWQASAFPSGLYILRLESMGRYEIAKVALIK